MCFYVSVGAFRRSIKKTGPVCVSMLMLPHLEDPSRKTCPVCVSMLVLAHLEDPSRKTCPVCVSMLGR